MKKQVMAGCGVIVMAMFLVAVLILWFGYRAFAPHVIEGYYFRDGKVFYSRGFFDRHMLFRSRERYLFELTDADYASFQVLRNGFAKDKSKAYFQNQLLKESHGQSFDVIDGHYAADDLLVYFQSKSISSRPNDFKVIANIKDGAGQGIYATDGEYIFWKGSIFLENVADVATFENISSTSYFRDKNNVYISYRTIQGADPETFKVLPGYDDVYATDKNNVFYDGKRVESAEVGSHRIIDKYRHRDERSVFVQDTKISDDPEGFVVLSSKSVNGYTKDGRNVYWGRKVISNDAQNFHLFPQEYSKGYSRDSRTIFWCGVKMESIDPNSFVHLNVNYVKDKENVYYVNVSMNQPQLVKNADAVTFEVYGNNRNSDAGDKNNYYKRGRTVRRKN